MATNGKTVSLKSIVERVYLDFGFSYSLSWNEAIEWAGSLIALNNAPVTLKPKVELITISGGRGVLPCDLESVIQTARALPAVPRPGTDLAIVATQGQGTFAVEACGIDLINRELTTACPIVDTCHNEYTLLPMRWATNTFHQKFHSTDWDYNRVSVSSENTYTMNGNYIFTSFQDGFCLMSYLAIPTDDEGFPLVPGDEWWMNAVKWEISYKIATKMWLADNMARDKKEFFERERDWYVAQAVNKSKIMSPDEMESWKNDWLRTIPKVNHHSNFFRNMQAPEQRYVHPIRYNW
jgi:hypothetical protein